MSESVSMDLIARDQRAVWHPYASAVETPALFPVRSAAGVRLTLTDGRTLIDGMASWWCAIHGYNHPVLNQAVTAQLGDMSHVMFGGLTHQPAIELAELLCALTPESLERVFFSDSGSVAVEVALKMAIQYWQGRGQPRKQKMLALRNGYHGDTLGAMSVCDPVTGMHQLFSDALTTQFFAEAPQTPFGAVCPEHDLASVRTILEQSGDSIAAVIVEPVLQGAGGMRFYSADYLTKLKALCDTHGVLLVFDEIATGFGRTGKLFALEHANVTPDILCLGKALTGGYMTLAATLCTAEIAAGVCASEAGAFMHGPTFMANPLACATALASVRLLLSTSWKRNVTRLETQLRQGLEPARQLAQVADVRCLGATGVIELHNAVDMQQVQPMFVERGVWVRPFGKLVYVMPPYIMSDADTSTLTAAMVDVVRQL